MPPAVGAVVGAGLSLYSANKASKDAKASQQMAMSAANAPRFTGRSSMNRDPITGGTGPGTGGLVVIDPTIRALRERALGRMPSYRQDITDASGLLNSRLEQTRDELASNENPFIQARVNPLLAQAAEGRGALSRGLVRRGLGGSSLYSSGMGNYDAAVGREIGDQRAIATREALDARTSMDQGIYNSAISALQAFQSLDAQEQSIAAQNLAQELSALGLSQADVGGILQAAGINLQAGQVKNDIYGRAFDTAGRALGSIFSKPSGTVPSGGAL